jgi:hypothetical protein
MREQGRSFASIAQHYGVSRERVRQLLRAEGGADTRAIAELRRRQAEADAEARFEELLELWRSGEQPGRAASKLGLQAAACRTTIARLASEDDHAARKAAMAEARRHAAQTYSDRAILTALKTVAKRLGHVPSPKEYTNLARSLELPSLATVCNRMGSWTEAIRAADMQPRGSARRTRARRWTVDACWAALRRVVTELGKIPTVLSYDRHAANRTDLPSSATLRNRLGRWSAIITQLVGQREPPVARSPAATHAAAIVT